MESETIGVLIIGFFIGYVVCMLISIFIIADGEKVTELGKAICEQEYDMDYNSYSGGELKCKDKVVNERYDGINIITLNPTSPN